LFDGSKLWQNQRISNHFRDEADKLSSRPDNPDPDFHRSLM